MSDVSEGICSWQDVSSGKEDRFVASPAAMAAFV
jgi:hypothetical protein